MNDLQQFVAIMTNGDDKFKLTWNDDKEESESKYVDFILENQGGNTPVHLRAVFNKSGKFEYFYGTCEYK